MIAAARALRDQVQSEAQLHETEAARLWAFVSELDAFIESADGGVPGTVAAEPEPPPSPPGGVLRPISSRTRVR